MMSLSKYFALSESFCQVGRYICGNLMRNLQHKNKVDRSLKKTFFLPLSTKIGPFGARKKCVILRVLRECGRFEEMALFFLVICVRTSRGVTEMNGSVTKNTVHKYGVLKWPFCFFFFGNLESSTWKYPWKVLFWLLWMFDEPKAKQKISEPRYVIQYCNALNLLNSCSNSNVLNRIEAAWMKKWPTGEVNFSLSSFYNLCSAMNLLS